MATPTPIYRVSYAGSYLPGYVQEEDEPISLRSSVNEILGRDSASIVPTGSRPRELTLVFNVLSQLGTDVSGLDHLNNCKAQYREALAILTRSSAKEQIRVGEADRYFLGVVSNVSAPITAGSSRKITYTVKFICDAWLYSVTNVSNTFASNGTVNLAMGDTRATYPIFNIPSTVTAFTATDAATGKVLEFIRGTAPGTLTINCGTLHVYRASTGIHYYTSIGGLNYGMYHSGAGTMSISITGYSGSGTVTVSMPHRYEL